MRCDKWNNGRRRPHSHDAIIEKQPVLREHGRCMRLVLMKFSAAFLIPPVSSILPAPLRFPPCLALATFQRLLMPPSRSTRSTPTDARSSHTCKRTCLELRPHSQGSRLELPARSASRPVTAAGAAWVGLLNDHLLVLPFLPETAVRLLQWSTIQLFRTVRKDQKVLRPSNRRSCNTVRWTKMCWTWKVWRPLDGIGGQW